MKHDAAIPFDLHVRTRDSVKDDLGAFWSSVFRDQDLVDAILESKVLSAGQFRITAMEDLSLRDHTDLPTYHREHWHPLFVRFSQRNMRRGLVIGMEEAVIGEQGWKIDPDSGELVQVDTIYNRDEKFVVGKNDDPDYPDDPDWVESKVNTYPFVAMNGCPLVRVRTCICDSISAPKHILVQGRDFDISGNVLTVRKEQDPFDRDGYRIVEVEDDRVAVLWVCDGEYDTNNVADFLSYPMGFDVESTEESKRLLSAYWDAVVYGLAPRYLNTMLGALYDIPTAESDETVEEVKELNEDEVDGDAIVVTDRRVYRIKASRLGEKVVAGAKLQAGDFLTDEIRVYHSFSETEFAYFVDHNEITRITLPVGSIAGVDVPVTVESRTSGLEDDWWFKLNGNDASDSAFWSRFTSAEDQAACAAAFARMATDSSVNPLKTVGYAALANTVVVYVTRPLVNIGYAGTLFKALQGLMPDYASLLTVSEVTGD